MVFGQSLVIKSTVVDVPKCMGGPRSLLSPFAQSGGEDQTDLQGLEALTVDNENFWRFELQKKLLM